MPKEGAHTLALSAPNAKLVEKQIFDLLVGRSVAVPALLELGFLSCNSSCVWSPPILLIDRLVHR